MADQLLRLTVAEREVVADDVVLLELAHSDGQALPTWDPGSHIDIETAAGLVRQYSLCGDRLDPGRWQIAVQLERDSRGGSTAVHSLRRGDTVAASAPRNHFPLRLDQAAVFVAGGIGITPIVPMVEAAAAAGLDPVLLYGGRSSSAMAFGDRLTAALGEQARTYPEDEVGLLPVADLVDLCTEPTTVYCCGPPGLVAAVHEALADVDSASVRSEQFVPIATTAGVERPFTVELAVSGHSLQVGADESILDVVTRAGVFVPSSCQEGTCGSCETMVHEGRPDHRDSVTDLDDPDRDLAMMICVSRALTDRLVLEL